MPKGFPKNGINRGWYKKGRHPSLKTEFKKGMIPWNKGRKLHYVIWNKDLKGYNADEKHPQWIKDRSKLAKGQYRHDSAYREWTKEVKKRDNNICNLKSQDCFGYNIVHHIKNWAKYPKLRYNINNGITLCQAHHPRKRAEEKQLESLFMDLVAKSV